MSTLSVTKSKPNPNPNTNPNCIPKRTNVIHPTNHTDPNRNNKTIKTQLFLTNKSTAPSHDVMFSNTLHLNYTGH